MAKCSTPRAPTQRLLSCLALDPGNLEIRLSLACLSLTPPVASQRYLGDLPMDSYFLRGLQHVLRGEMDLAAERCWVSLVMVGYGGFYDVSSLVDFGYC